MIIEALVLSGSGAAIWYNLATQFKPIRKRVAKPRKPLAQVGPNRPFNPVQLVKDFRNSLKEQGHHQLRLDIDPKALEEAEQARKEGKRSMVIAGGAMSLALLGIAYPALTVISGFAIAYLSRYLFIRVWNDVKRGHYISVFVVDLISTLGLLFTGQMILAAIGGIIGGFFAGIVNRIEENSEAQLMTVFSGHPQRVWLLRDGAEIDVDFQSVQPGDQVVVNAGEIIPVDGKVSAGEGSVDQQVLTGESSPVDKSEGEAVLASTLLLSGRLTIQVEQAGNTTVAAKIGDVLTQTQVYKDTMMVRGREVADRFVPLTLGLSAATVPVLGVYSALAITWASLGDMLAYSGPMSMLSYLQILSKKNILIKDGRVFESLRDVDTIVFDKTGTLTLEQPAVGAIHALGEFSQDEVLRFAAAAEYRQPHPIAKAILAKADEAELTLPAMDNASYDVGYGIQVEVEGKRISVGSARFMERSGIPLPPALDEINARAEEDGSTLIHVGVDDQLAGVLEVHPVIRPEAPEIIQSLQQRGIRVYILSGDHEAPTRGMARQLGVDHYFSEVLPENKGNFVNRLRREGRFVCFVGDGINDAIALKAAQVSVSLKGASTVATDTAQVVFMDGSLKRLEELFQFADEFEVTMQNNIAISIVPGTIIIAGVYLLHLGIAPAMAIFYASCFLGMSNVVWPLIKHQEEMRQTALPTPETSVKGELPATTAAG